MKSKVNVKNRLGTSLWKAIFIEHRLPWRVKIVGIPNYFILRHIYSLFLRLSFFISKQNLKEDITVVIGVKNRYDHKIINAFKSIRNQDYNQSLIKTILVDYDSDKKLINKFKKLCKDYDVEYVRVDDKPVWNRAHCLNIGIKRAKTKYVLTSDTDIVFEKNYIKESLKKLKKNPFQVLLCHPIYLEKNHKNPISNYNELKKGVASREGGGINLTLSYFYKKIKGYDEKYKVWGKEDNDLMKRFWCLGIKTVYINDNTSYLHQYHKGFSGTENIKNRDKIMKENEIYFMKSRSIVRNKDGWGIE